MYLHKSTNVEIMYYFISLSLLILRMFFICLYASWIHEENKNSLQLLSDIPREIYNKEV